MSDPRIRDIVKRYFVPLYAQPMPLDPVMIDQAVRNLVDDGMSITEARDRLRHATKRLKRADFGTWCAAASLYDVVLRSHRTNVMALVNPPGASKPEAAISGAAASLSRQGVRDNFLTRLRGRVFTR